MIAALLSLSALAEEECLEFTTADLRIMLDDADDAFAAGQVPGAQRVLSQAQDDMACLVDTPHVDDLARFAGTMALVAFYDQDEVETARWGSLRRVTNPQAAWTLEAPPAFLAQISELADPSRGSPDGGVQHPKKAAIFLNSALLEGSAAPAEVPNFVQLVEKKGTITESFWQDGAAFRSDLVGGDGTPPKWSGNLASVAAARPGRATPIGDVGEHEAGWVAAADETAYMPDCPWAGQKVKADADDTSVTVNGKKYPVGTTAGHNDFLKVLKKCYESAATRRFERWRKAQKESDYQVQRNQVKLQNNVSLSGVAGLAGGGAYAAQAALTRKAMLKALRD